VPPGPDFSPRPAHQHGAVAQGAEPCGFCALVAFSESTEPWQPVALWFRTYPQNSAEVPQGSTPCATALVRIAG